jgi:lipoate-protein ligase A
LGLLSGLEKLGLPIRVVRDPQNAHDVDEPVCFQIPSNFEITFQGKKLIGSAQARKKKGVLQHGSLPLHGDLTRIIEVLSFKDGKTRTRARQRLLEKAVNVEMVGVEMVSWEKAAQALTAGFEEALQIEFEEGELTPWELNRAQELMAERYQNAAWTNRI